MSLRNFVTGVELGSFALAVERWRRSTSAVNAQLKKLERRCGAGLLQKDGRHLRLSDQGELMMGYARRLLAANDEALQAVGGIQVAGEVHFVMQEDFGETLLPDILGQFSRAFPGVQISARIARNGELLQAIAQRQLDLALSWLDEETMPAIPALAQLPLHCIMPLSPGGRCLPAAA